ncbi:MAG: hypothetical protein M3680_36040 [Myxococcota bacterium]|nr:hypothetical protein [Myxococcota bacterium]
MPTTCLLAGLALGGCGDKQALPKVSVTADHVAAVNAAIPADLKGTLEFELGTIVEGKGSTETYKLARPKGWKAGFMPGSLAPVDADHMGSSPTVGKTEMDVGSNCDGRCEEKDWAAISDKVNFAQFTSGQVEGKVLKDVKGTRTRTLVFERKVSEHFPEKDVAINIVTAWWADGGVRYFTCSVDVGVPLKGAVDAFEKACSKISGG